jgi:hypothetical protein
VLKKNRIYAAADDGTWEPFTGSSVQKNFQESTEIQDEIANTMQAVADTKMTIGPTR